MRKTAMCVNTLEAQKISGNIKYRGYIVHVAFLFCQMGNGACCGNQMQKDKWSGEVTEKKGTGVLCIVQK